MKAIKLVAILAMLWVSFSVRAVCPVQETTVMFINGVWTTEPEAVDHKDSLQREARKAGISVDCVHFDYSHTQDDGYASDVAESIIQKSTEFAVNISELTRMLLRLITPDVIFGNLIDGVFTRNVGEVVDTQLDKHLLKFKGLTHFDDPDPTKRQRGIALTHSQGGLYGNSLFGRLNLTERLNTRMITVATPAQEVADGGPNTRLSRDGVENLFFLNALASGLVSNTDRLCDVEKVTGANSWLCHGFDTGYLHDLRTREQIVDDITKALPGATIRGVVRNSDTTRAGEATVSLFSSSGVLVAETTTPPVTGTYRFGDIKVPCPNCFLKAKNQAGTVCATVPVPLTSQGLYTIDVTLNGICVVSPPPVVQYFRLTTGNPGIPGDGVFANAGGPFGESFELLPSFSLQGITNGITVSTFPFNTPLQNLNVKVNFMMKGKTLAECSLGSSSGLTFTPAVNGVVGLRSNFPQSLLNIFVGVFRSFPACANTTLADLIVSGVEIVDNTNLGNPIFIRQLDAIAIGIGENVFPTSATPAP